MSQHIAGQVVGLAVTPPESSIAALRLPQVRVTFEGFEGDRHSGITMRSDSRTPHYPRGTEIRNARQVSIVSGEDLAEAAATLGVPHIAPEWLGANIAVSGIPALSLLPPSTRLFFANGVTLVVEGENLPCTIAGGAVQARYPDTSGLTSAFPRAALHLRGIVAWVERPGTIREGETVRADLPDQPPYGPAQDGAA